MEPLRVDPEFKALIPPLTKEERDQLEANILRDGILDPLKVWRGQWTLLDGHNRYEIAQKHGLDYEVSEVDCATREDAEDWIDRNQLGRRNLKPDQFTLLIGRCFNRTKKKVGRPVDKFPQIEGIETAESLAKEFGVSRATVERAGAFANAVETLGVEKEVAQGTFSAPRSAVIKAAKLLDSAPEKARAILSGEAKMAEVMRQEKAEQIIKKAELPGAKYRVVYADPPWSYRNTQPDYHVVDPRDHYPTMNLAEICAMPIKDMVEDNAVLFLWVTSPMLEESFEVIKAWGFKYKSSFVWDKVKHNMGHYNSVRHELLLVCVRGSCTPEVKKLYDSVVQEDRTEHSKKPAVFREIIDVLYPSGKRLELFAREKTENWEVFGYEV